METNNTTTDVQVTPVNDASVSQVETENTSVTSQEDANQQQKPAYTLEQYEKMVADLRKENAGHRTRLKTFEADQKAREEAQLSKEQLLEKQLAELKAQYEENTAAQTETHIRNSITVEAAKAGINAKHLDKVARFLDWEQIDLDEQTGQPTNIAALISDLVKDMPELLNRPAVTPAASGGATNPSRTQSHAPQALSWSVIGHMTQAEYTARADEIRQWIAANPFRYGQQRH